MTGPMRSCARDVLSIETPDDPLAGVAAVAEPSADLLDRARRGWERFLGTCSEAADE
ncbi:hypothetical protein [Streptomyces sp. NBC_00091]|uniref:hypothetical protein n=1 Tax=Streptomyces sp. NBC_00091 TaxID=2975648 RepID=UPI002250ABC1|nr:hypothetical protein [Streptomyces sp. NBC_00091]MCX5381369.1 hypothetical protein [Streptomyces sp. NBC_00091]